MCQCIHVFKYITPYSSDAWEVKTGLPEWANVALMSLLPVARADYRTLGNVLEKKSLPCF